MKIFLSVLSLCASLCLHSQTSISSQEIIDKGVALRDENKFKESIELFRTVSINDSNYYQSVYEMANSYYLDSQYAVARKYYEEGVRIPNDYTHLFLNQYGMVLDKMAETDKGFAILDSAIATYPGYASPYVNKSNILIRLNRFKEAEELLQKCLIRLPFSSTAHYNLALAALNQGKIIQSYLCFTTALLISPEGSYVQNASGLMNRIAKGDEEMLGYLNNRKEEADENYQLVEQLLISKAVLDKSYKLQTNLDDPITRQLQMILEKLDYDENNKDFYIQYYLPLYKEVYQNKKLTELTNLMFSGINLPQIAEYLKKNKKETAAFAETCNLYLNNIRNTRQLNFTKRTTDNAIYHHEGGACIAKGKIKGDNPEGNWEFYYNYGNLKSSGKFNAGSKRDGLWKYYYENGALKETEMYSNGELQGENIGYDEKGNIISKSIFVKNKREGEYIKYYSTGNIMSKEMYKDGKENGKFFQYYKNGNIKLEIDAKDGDANGQVIQYFENGSLQAKGRYLAGKSEGPYQFYHENGKLKMEGNFTLDKKEGEWKTYYENGALKSIEHYTAGELNGPYSEQYDNGKPFFQQTYKNGKVDGEVVYFSREGNKFSTITMRNGALKAASYYDRKGKLISSSDGKGKGFLLTTYRADGVKNVETNYSDKGVANGRETSFFGSGRVSETSTYKEGLLDGIQKSFFADGKLQSETNYKNGVQEGLYRQYYKHQQLNTEGNYSEDQKTGEWKFYDERGTLLKVTNYTAGELDGVRDAFYPNGKISRRDIFDSGILLETVQYDSTGKEYNRVKLPSGSGKYVLKHMNGKLMAEGNYVNGYLQGVYNEYFSNGKLESREYFNKGFSDSTYVYYQSDGKIDREGKLKKGHKDGEWKFYNNEGKLYYTENYENALLVKRTYYHANGKIDSETPFTNGVKDGWVTSYAESGEVMYKARFYGDEMQEYSYEDKNGNMVTPVVLAGATGKVLAYYRNGGKSAEYEYSAGEYNGLSKTFSPNGKTLWESQEDYGHSEGTMKNYYPDGQLKLLRTYWHNTLQGKYQAYYPGARIRIDGQYDLDYKHGTWKYYDEAGKLVRTEEYFYGTMVNDKQL